MLDLKRDKSSKTRVITCSTFDLAHAGHLLMLEECKRLGDEVIALLQYDPSVDRSEKNSPIETLYERQVRLRSCKYIDDIIVYTTENVIDVKNNRNNVSLLSNTVPRYTIKIKEV